MTKNPRRWIVRIVMNETDFKAFEAACEEERLSMSGYGRQLLLRGVRRRSRDKSLQNPETPSGVARAK